MDAIVSLTADLTINHVNPAGQRLLHGAAGDLIGRNLRDFLDPSGQKQIDAFVRKLDNADVHTPDQLWIPCDLEMCRCSGTPFPAEATLSRYEAGGEHRYTLILRNIDERIEAEKRIRELAQEAEYLRDIVHDPPGVTEILGQSPAVSAMLGSIGKVAQTDATVLIGGETGTGKELVARAIHNASPRADKPIIRVNCAAIPTNLMESEFFGHEKGAFTGATARRQGRFDLADGGTIFLDEIGELPLNLQAKLLRVLQEGEFEPLGSAKTHRVDVRVIAATNRDLHKRVKEGEFREDLYYRLSVFPIAVPALRDRGDDVTLLASAFAQRYGRRMGRRIDPLTEHDLDVLRRYDWPGNVRELQNVIERAIILSSGAHLELRAAMPRTADRSVDDAPAATPNTSREILTAREMEDLERSNIRRALEASRGKVAGAGGAASLLDVPPSTLNSRIKSLGIKRRPKPAP
jgi:PAS domain S-box-containing protein